MERHTVDPTAELPVIPVAEQPTTTTELGEFAQAARDRHVAHINALFERLGIERPTPTE